MFKKLALGCGGLIALAVVIIVIAAVAGGSSTKTAQAPTRASLATSQNQPAASTQAPSQGALSPGQAAKIGDLQVTLTGARVMAPSQFDQPKPGDQYIVTDWSVQNTTSKPYNLSTILQVSLLDKDGRKYTPALLGNLRGSIDGTVPPNDKAAGEVAFEVPTASAPYRARFAQPFGSTTADWTVRLVP